MNHILRQKFTSKRLWASLTSRQSRLWFSTASQPQPIRILYASQGGTAQIFAQQLAEELEELPTNSSTPTEVSIEGWHEYSNKDPQTLLTPGTALHVFLTSVAGVGDPPDNGRAFYEWITSQNKNDNSDVPWKDLEYTVFGLGNSKAHPKHYNVTGIELDRRLESMGAERVFPLGLGDDGDCIEDDFDIWMEQLVDWIQSKNSTSAEDSPTDEVEDEPDDETLVEAEELVEPTTATTTAPQTYITCASTVSRLQQNQRLQSTKHPTLQLSPPTTQVVRHNLFHLQDTDQSFYRKGTVEAKVQRTRALSAYGGEAGMREIILSHSGLQYKTGDHLIVYPRNSDAMVEAYLNLLDVSPHTIIEGTTNNSQTYPFPTGLTVQETLSHCVDLGALPSPSVCRHILNRSDIIYKQEIAYPRRTLLDLLLETGQHPVALEDLLYSLPPMQARYYSIASSSHTPNSDKLRLTYRPVKYVTSRGNLREGTCTSYLSTMAGMEDMVPSIGKLDPATHSSQCLSVAINDNPTFRLPADPNVPIMLIAGGCGVAPIRAFAEERLSMVVNEGVKVGPAYVYLGFRSPEDEVYRPLMNEAVAQGALTDVQVTYTTGLESQSCRNVSQLVQEESNRIWEHLENGGITYLCGGARSFGAAMYQELLDIICKNQPTDLQGAEDYLRKLLEEGRLLEDLAE